MPGISASANAGASALYLCLCALNFLPQACAGFAEP